MADLNLARQLASSIVESLKHEGHILIAKGKGEALLRELAEHIQPVLVTIMPRVLRSEVHGEVSSTFGDEATDEAVEALVENIRETLIESEGVEDVFAEDKVMERVIFRGLATELVALARVSQEEDEEDKPPISVRLGTLGYVAATAAKLSDQETLRDALERAALAASTELDKFDSETSTAVFAAREDDPDKRLEIEEAVEEELADLVEMGVVDLPRVERVVPLPMTVGDAERKALAKEIALVADRTLTSRVCPATWEWHGNGALKLAFTPLSEPDAKTVGELAAAFARELEAHFQARTIPTEPAAKEPPRSERSRAAARPEPPPSSRGTTAPAAAPSARGKESREPPTRERMPKPEMSEAVAPPSSRKRAPASAPAAAPPPSSPKRAAPPDRARSSPGAVAAKRTTAGAPKRAPAKASDGRASEKKAAPAAKSAAAPKTKKAAPKTTAKPKAAKKAGRAAAKR